MYQYIEPFAVVPSPRAADLDLDTVMIGCLVQAPIVAVPAARAV